MQMMVSGEALARIHRYPEKGKNIACAPVGQIVGRMKNTISAKDQVMEMVMGYLDTTERLTALLNDE